jgi:hypothetical protein
MRGIARYSSSNKTVNIHVETVDQHRLKGFFRQELELYNNLITIFESRVRGFPQTVVGITDELTNLFCDVVSHQWNIRDLISDPENAPTRFQSYRSLVFDRHNRMNLTPAHLLILEEAGRDRSVVIPETRGLMARAVVEHFQEQAAILSQPQKSEKIDIAYRVPPRNLSVQSMSVKRHVQVPRRDVKFHYNHELEQTELQTPLNTRPISIPLFNLNELNGWTTVIFKQESGRDVDFNTPWVADFKHTGNRYLLTYNDLGSRNRD